MALSVESIHPSLWRASQLARGHGRVVDTAAKARVGPPSVIGLCSTEVSQASPLRLISGIQTQIQWSRTDCVRLSVYARLAR
jgi:hypothetical protein